MLNLGGGDLDTNTPMGSMISPIVVALVRVELGIECHRIIESVIEAWAVGQDLGGRRPAFIDSQIR